MEEALGEIERFALFQGRWSLTGSPAAIGEEQMFDEHGGSQSQHAVDHDGTASINHPPALQLRTLSNIICSFN